MSHAHFFHANAAIVTDLSFPYDPVFRTDTFLLSIPIGNSTLSIDVRALLHHSASVASVDHDGTTKLAIRNGRFTGVELVVGDDGPKCVASHGKTVLGSFDTMTEAARKRATFCGNKRKRRDETVVEETVEDETVVEETVEDTDDAVITNVVTTEERNALGFKTAIVLE